jgi:two-component system, NarL family, response regulator LiaR
MGTEQKIGVVIVDDHAMTRMGLSFMLKTFTDITLLAEAESGAEALDVCAEYNPDVVLMDMRLPDREGPEVIAALRRRMPAVSIVALSSFDDRALIERALQAGAISYVLKNVSALDLVKAIRRAMHGKATLAPEAVQVLVEQFQRPQQPNIDFTEREWAVLRLMSKGQSNSQIAGKLFISAATVKGHVGMILNKLNVATRAEAIAYAWANGLVEREENDG